MLRNVTVDLCNLEQLCLANRIVALACHLLCQICVAVCQMNDCVCGHDFRAVEEALLQILFIRVIELCQLLFRFLLDAAETLSQDAIPRRGVLAVAANELTVNEDRAVGAQLLNISRSHQTPAVKGTLILPVVLYLLGIDLLALLAQIERVKRTGADGVQLRLNNAGSAIGTQQTSAWLECNAADQQLMILNIDVLLFANSLVARGFLNNPRLTLGLLEAFRQILGIVDVHLNASVQILLTQGFNTFHILLSHV